MPVNILPVNILPVKKETYYCNIKEISKEKQDGTHCMKIHLYCFQ